MPANEPKLETKDKVIDGCTYSVTQFTGREALKIKLKLIKILAPVVSSFTSAIDMKGKSISESDLDISKIGDAVNSLLDSMPEDDFIDFIMRMISNTRKDNKEISNAVFDLDFAGNLSTVYKVLYFVIQVNYPDFFQMGASIGNLTEKFQGQVLKKKELES